MVVKKHLNWHFWNLNLHLSLLTLSCLFVCKIYIVIVPLRFKGSIKTLPLFVKAPCFYRVSGSEQHNRFWQGPVSELLRLLFSFICYRIHTAFLRLFPGIIVRGDMI